jgi:hypothetical protein
MHVFFGFEIQNLVIDIVKVHRFSAAIFQKYRGVPRCFPKKDAKSVCHVLVAKKSLLKGYVIGQQNRKNNE